MNFSEIFKTLLIEVRPRLQSVNVFLVLLNKNNGLCEVELNTRSFKLTQNEVVENIYLDDIEITETSLSSLINNDSHVSFRFTTNDEKNVDAFKTELLAINNSLAKVDINKTNTFLKINQSYDITCKNCSQDFCTSVSFKRILPLPSDHVDSGDYFCHAHGDSSKNLDPKETDIFYNQSYFHLNTKHIHNIITNKYLSCSRCLSWIGIKVNDDTSKLWFNTVNFVDEKLNKLTTSPLDDTYSTIRCFLKESLFNSTKVVLSCQVNDLKVDYLLLWIIEKKLNVFISYDCNLKNTSMGKVLFKFESGATPLVDSWLQNVSISNVSISKPMMLSILKYLYQMNGLIPKEFSISNDFYISYLAMYEHD